MDLKINSIFKLEVSGIIYDYQKVWRKEFYNAHGTGFAISETQMLTNAHVVANATNITARNQYGSFECQLLRKDDILDLALLEFKTDLKIEPLEFGEIVTGEEVIAQGYPWIERGLNLTKGIISKLTKIRTGRGKVLVYQTDTAIFHGNSGGPVMRAYESFLGKTNSVIGISFAMKYTGIHNFIIPYFIIKKFLDNQPLYYYNKSWQAIPDFLGGGIHLIDDKKKILKFENLDIHSGGQIKLCEILKKMGFKAEPKELISFHYCFYLLGPVKNFNLVKIESIEHKKPSIKIFGGFIFTPVNAFLSFNLNLPYGLTYISFIVQNEFNLHALSFIGSVININWNEFDIKKKFEFPIFGDKRKLYINPEEAKYTESTEKLFFQK